jgi:MOSC domain-containing protein YiiM
LPGPRSSSGRPPTNLEGDGQADLRNHGGRDKAVYAYPAAHLAIWAAEHGLPEPYCPGAFGENLTIGGWTEEEVCIGDRWQWGETLLEVAQPRYPCFKLGLALDRHAVVRELVANGRTGWYLRVVQPGIAPVAGPIRLVGRAHAGPTVLDAHLARLPEAPRDLIERVAAAPDLAEGLRHHLLASLDLVTS